MSLTDAQVTAAPAPLYLDGEEYTASPMTDLDFAEFDEWVQGRFVKMARLAAPQGMAPEEVSERNEITQVAMLTAMQVTFLTDEGQRILSSRLGVAKLTQFMLRKEHPKLDIETLLKYMRSPVNIENVRILFRKQNADYFGSGESGNGKPEGNGSEAT